MQTSVSRRTVGTWESWTISVGIGFSPGAGGSMAMSIDSGTPSFASRAAPECRQHKRFGGLRRTLAGLIQAGDVLIETTPGDELLDVTSAETTVKYEGYLVRQEQCVTRAQASERRRIPAGFPFHRVPGLSREMVQRFSETKPETLGQAQRIPGVTPAAVAVVGAYLDRFW